MADEIRDSLHSCSSFGHTFQTTDIKRAVDDMKFGKANGLDGLASEHFKYASEKLFCYASVLMPCYYIVMYLLSSVILY